MFWSSQKAVPYKDLEYRQKMKAFVQRSSVTGNLDDPMFWFNDILRASTSTEVHLLGSGPPHRSSFSRQVF